SVHACASANPLTQAHRLMPRSFDGRIRAHHLDARTNQRALIPHIIRHVENHVEAHARPDIGQAYRHALAATELEVVEQDSDRALLHGMTVSHPRTPRGCSFRS